MKQPKKWRECPNPFEIKFKNFKLVKILGYPHAGNDVFYVKCIYNNKTTFAFLKIARGQTENFKNEVNLLNSLKFPKMPKLIDCGENFEYIITKKLKGYRLSYIFEKNKNVNILEYMKEYGKMLAKIHSLKTKSPIQCHRKFFDIPSKEYCIQNGFEEYYEYLISNKPQNINYCFCHGDFHYANILWTKTKISGILDWELSGYGNKEFDIAWSIINRPSQNFLKTKKEINAFIQGYKEIGICNFDYIKYYMIQIYLYFYNVNKKDENYKKYIKKALKILIN